MSASKIQWTDKTDNPIHLRGDDGQHGGHWCRKTAPECLKCYAERTNSNTGYFSFASGLKYQGQPPSNLIFDHTIVEKWPRATKPWKRFVCSMTDLFGEWTQYSWHKTVFDNALAAPTQTIQLLTKWPGVAASSAQQWMQETNRSSMPANIWMGVTVGCQQSADRHIESMRFLNEYFPVTWVSYEPGLSAVDWQPYSFIDWLVMGGESGKDAREFRLEWLQQGLEACDRYDIAPFVKQMGDNPILLNGQSGNFGPKGSNFDLWPDWAKIRRFPEKSLVAAPTV